MRDGWVRGGDGSGVIFSRDAGVEFAAVGVAGFLLLVFCWFVVLSPTRIVFAGCLRWVGSKVAASDVRPNPGRYIWKFALAQQHHFWVPWPILVRRLDPSQHDELILTRPSPVTTACCAMHFSMHFSLIFCYSGDIFVRRLPDGERGAG